MDVMVGAFGFVVAFVAFVFDDVVPIYWLEACAPVSLPSAQLLTSPQLPVTSESLGSSIHEVSALLLKFPFYWSAETCRKLEP